MNRLVLVLSDERLKRPLCIALCVTLSLLMLICMFAPPLMAWFKTSETVHNAAQISNFVTNVQYTTKANPTADSDWKSVQAGAPIEITKEQVGALKIRVGYTGMHKAYLRVKLFGDYMNRHSKTHLSTPQETPPFTPVEAAGWLLHTDGYMYYTQTLGSSEGSLTYLPTFSVDSDISVYNASEHQEYNAKIYVLVEAVQTDRYDELWNLSSLPFVPTV